MAWLQIDCSRLFQSRIFLFVFACISGFMFAFLWIQYEQTVQLSSSINHYSLSLADTGYKKWIQQNGLERRIIPEENVSYAQTFQEMELSYLREKIPVLCMIFVRSRKIAATVKNTWAKHCNIATYFGSFVDEKIPVFKVSPISFQGFCQAFVSVWRKYENAMKWMIILDEKTYAIIENLRYYVAALNSSHPYYLGHPVKDFSNIYNVADAGIVLSHGAMELIFTIYPDGESCVNKEHPSRNYDSGIGHILRKFGVVPVDTRDKKTRGRFNLFPVEKMMIPGYISVFNSYWRSSVYLSSEGRDCCSNHAITFHGVHPGHMYLFEYMMYHIKPFHISPLGLGNRPPLHDHMYKVDEKENEIGEPYIRTINFNYKTNSMQTNQEKTTLEGNTGTFQKLWNEIFNI